MKQNLRFLMLALLCAVFSTTWGQTGTLVSSLGNIKDGETYYIAALNSSKYYTVPNTTINGQTFTCTEGTLNGTTLTPATGAGEFLFIAVSDINNAFYIFNTNLQKYLVATGSKKFGYVDSSSSDYGYWAFSNVTSGGFSGKFSVQHSSKTQYMRAYQNAVKCYDGTSNDGVYLFLKSTSTDPIINCSDVELEYNAESGEIVYTITNPIENQTIVASTNASWISNLTVSTDKVTFNTTINEGSENRSANISLTYGTVSKTVTVTQKYNKPGTENNPYTVAQAIEFIGTLGDNSSEVVYVKGIISQIDNINTTNYYNATYWISDDGTTTQQLQVYRGYYFENINEGHFTSDDLISVGDEVTIKGKLKKYNNTPEFDTGSFIVDQKGKEVIATDVTISPTKININEEGTFTTTVTAADGIIANDYTVSYLCNASDFIVDESTGEYMAGSTTGTFNVSVTVAPTQEKSDTYKSFSKTFEVTVVDPNANDGSLEKPYTVAEVKQLYSANNSIELADKYVTGYIAGCFKDNSFSQTATDVNSNIALSDIENGIDNIIPVQLPNNSILRAALNLKDNDNLNMKVVVKGTIKKYFNQAGINPTTDAYIYTTITSAGYSTLYFNTALEVPEGITAYAVKVNGNDLTYTPVASPIPANTGVVLKGSGEQRFHVTTTTKSISDNNLLGFNKTSVTTGPNGETTGYIFYMLSGGENGVGFYFATKDANGDEIAYEDQEGQAFKSAAHKAYLAVEDNGSTTVSSFVFDEFTDINTVKTQTRAPEGVYSITGIRMDGNHLPAGLYIVNGKKVIIR